MSQITIKINGKKLQFFDSFAYSVQINTISSGISFNSFIDFEDFGYQKVEVLRNGILIFTGEIKGKSRPESTPPNPISYKAESLTSILSESTLPTEAYPLQLENSTLKDIVEYICSFFNVEVVFDVSAISEANQTYELADLEIGKKAADIINELVTQVGLILTHDAYGRLIVTKSILQNQINLPRYLSSGKSFDLKKLYYNYIALGQAPIGEDQDIQAIARFTNIDQRRNITKIQDSGGVDTIENKALGMRADSLKAITQTLTFLNFFPSVGDFIKVDNNKLIINQLDYSLNFSGESTSISLLDSQIYER